MINKKLIVNRLNELAEVGDPRKRGICNAIRDLCWFPDLDFISKKYPHYSGVRLYPVIGGREAYLDNVFTGDMWQGEYGQNRKELCSYVAEEIDKMNTILFYIRYYFK